MCVLLHAIRFVFVDIDRHLVIMVGSQPHIVTLCHVYACVYQDEITQRITSTPEYREYMVIG